MSICIVANHFGFDCFEFGFILGMLFGILISCITMLLLKRHDALHENQQNKLPTDKSGLKRLTKISVHTKAEVPGSVEKTDDVKHENKDNNSHPSVKRNKNEVRDNASPSSKTHSQHPKEFASQGEEETNALQGEANSLEVTPTEDEVCGVTSRNSSADTTKVLLWCKLFGHKFRRNTDSYHSVPDEHCCNCGLTKKEVFAILGQNEVKE